MVGSEGGGCVCTLVGLGAGGGCVHLGRVMSEGGGVCAPCWG